MKRIPIALMVLTIFLNICWTLVESPARDALTVMGVSTFALASASHARTFLTDRSFFQLVAIVLATSLVAELIGVHTAAIFGHYSYSDRLGLMLWQVPIIIPFAWFMMFYPSLHIGWALSPNNRFVSAAITAWTMASWDLYDP